MGRKVGVVISIRSLDHNPYIKTSELAPFHLTDELEEYIIASTTCCPTWQHYALYVQAVTPRTVFKP